MGDLQNKPLTKLWAILGLVLLVALAISNFYNLIT